MAREKHTSKKDQTTVKVMESEQRSPDSDLELGEIPSTDNTDQGTDSCDDPETVGEDSRMTSAKSVENKGDVTFRNGDPGQCVLSSTSDSEPSYQPRKSDNEPCAGEALSKGRQNKSQPITGKDYRSAERVARRSQWHEANTRLESERPFSVGDNNGSGRCASGQAGNERAFQNGQVGMESLHGDEEQRRYIQAEQVAGLPPYSRPPSAGPAPAAHQLCDNFHSASGKSAESPMRSRFGISMKRRHSSIHKDQHSLRSTVSNDEADCLDNYQPSPKRSRLGSEASALGRQYSIEHSDGQGSRSPHSTAAARLIAAARQSAISRQHSYAHDASAKGNVMAERSRSYNQPEEVVVSRKQHSNQYGDSTEKRSLLPGSFSTEAMDSRHHALRAQGKRRSGNYSPSQHDMSHLDYSCHRLTHDRERESRKRSDGGRQGSHSSRKLSTVGQGKERCSPRGKSEGSGRLPRNRRAEGTVCQLLPHHGEPYAGFLRPSRSLPDGYAQRDVYFKTSSITSSGLQLKCGDQVSFTLGTHNPKKPMALGGLLIGVDSKQRSGEDVRALLNYSLRLFDAENMVDEIKCIDSGKKSSSDRECHALSYNANCMAMHRCSLQEECNGDVLGRNYEKQMEGVSTVREGGHSGHDELPADQAMPDANVPTSQPVESVSIPSTEARQDDSLPKSQEAPETHPVLQVSGCRAVWTWLLSQTLSSEDVVHVLSLACAIAKHNDTVHSAVGDFFRTMLNTTFMLPTVGRLADWLTDQVKHAQGGGSVMAGRQCKLSISRCLTCMDMTSSLLDNERREQVVDYSLSSAGTEQVMDNRGAVSSPPLQVLPNSPSSTILSSPNLSLLMEFIHHIAIVMPTHLRQIMAICRPLVDAADHPVARFLFGIIQLLRYEGDGEVQFLAWHALPLVPTYKELLMQPAIADPLQVDLTKQPLLREVHIGEGYCSADIYMDTYFRLLREDCFAGLREGVQHLLAGTLDARDMHTYKHIKLVDIRTNRESQTGLSLLLKFKTERAVRNWKHCRRLMFGSLLCISFDGKFTQPLWLTVLERDVARLEKSGVITAQLCNLQWQKIPLSQAVRQLQSAQEESTVMAESPAYYRSIAPVLDTLQHMNPESMPFQDELVHVQKCDCAAKGNSTGSFLCRPPSYIQPDTAVNVSVLFNSMPDKQGPKSETVEFLCEEMLLQESHQQATTLDMSQQRAVLHALSHRLAIIEGPPGTGKTFVGVQLLRLLLSASTRPPGPVLVLTYKNHALDEFLKQCIGYYGVDAVARLGGRCHDKDLEPCLLRSQRKGDRIWRLLPLSIRKSMHGVEDRVRCQESSANDVIERLGKARVFSKFSFLEHVNDSQLNNFLLNHHWLASTRNPRRGQVRASDIARWKNYKPNDLSLREFLLGPVPRQLKSHKLKVNEAERNGGCYDDDDYDSDDDDLEEQEEQEELERQREAYNRLHYWLDKALQMWIPTDKDVERLLENRDADQEGKSKHTPASRRQNNASQLTKNSTPDHLHHHRLPEQLMPSLNDSEKSFDWDVEDEEIERMAACDSHGVSRYKDSEGISAAWLSASDAMVTQLQPELLKKLLAKHDSESLSAAFLQVIDVWSLSILERAIFIQLLLEMRTKELDEELESSLDNYEHECSLLREQHESRDKYLLEKKKIIGMTICGASIHHRLLSQLKPAIVLVEEAAEVLEPQVTAVLQEYVQHLILIGDHKQLRPPIETHLLRLKYHFDVSMMERLVKSGIAHTTLEQQNRMRPEVAELLWDIYPSLRTNLKAVKDNAVPRCMPAAAFFWDHDSPEEYAKDNIRSYTNEEEAKRVVRLVCFLVMQGYDTRRITILAAYKGQVALLRSFLQGPVNDVLVQTIDNYQGDENDIVIVSLVRSNRDKMVGFLSECNRRCVAQSRARCGVYFIGSKDTLCSNSHWRNLLHSLSENGLVSTGMQLSCRKHPDQTQFIAFKAEDIKITPFCEEICGHVMDCTHTCRLTCKPGHEHTCKEIVRFTFPRCGHTVDHVCGTVVGQCTKEVTLQLENCGHIATKKCWVVVKDVRCEERCSRKRTCGHACDRRCFENCEKFSCKVCRKVAEEKKRQEEKERHEAIRQEIETELAKLQQEGDADKPECTCRELEPKGDDALEYYDISDLTEKFVQPGHNFYLQVTKIEKVFNRGLYRQWLEVKLEKKLVGDSGHLKFHGTGDEATQSILREGFRLPERVGMFGRGVYFATDSSKSAQDKYTKGSNTLLVCRVLLGRSKSVSSADLMLCEETLAKEGYHSVFAMRNTKGSQGVRYDEYVIYDPRQALPCYVVYYNKVKSSLPVQHRSLEQQALSTGSLMRFNLKRSRDVELTDEKQIHYTFAQSCFLDGMQARDRKTRAPRPAYRISNIEYVINPKLLRQFDKKREEFKKAGKPTTCVFAFHGTAEENITSILQENFSLSRIKRGLYGHGIYFSEFPDVAMDYAEPKSGECAPLLLCKVLEGKPFDCKLGEQMNSAPLQAGYDSHRVQADIDGYGEMLVVFDEAQILPCYVIEYRR